MANAVYPTLWVCPECFEVRGNPGECQEVHNHPEALEAGDPFPERIKFVAEATLAPHRERLTPASDYVIEEVRKTLQAWLDSPLRAVPKERVRGLLDALSPTEESEK